jgi:hypothetical protein
MRQFTSAIGYSLHQAMITFSAIAYTSFDSIATLQDRLNSPESLDQSYVAMWWARNSSNLIYVVKNKYNDDYVITVRGPDFRFGLSLLPDLSKSLDISHQVSMPYSRLGNSKIASGILTEVQNICELACNGITLNSLINYFPEKAKVYITGYSLGGAICSALSAKFACSNSRKLELVPFTFGAPSIGNKSFSDLFDYRHLNCLFPESSRCVNCLDIIPYTWSNLGDIQAIYHENIKSPVEFTQIAERIDSSLIAAGVFYAQQSSQLELKGGIEYKGSFMAEAMYQHDLNTYLSLLSLSPVNIAAFSLLDQQANALASSL